MRLLAISYVLPPALAPQAIQIGRLLASLPAEIGTVSGEMGPAAAPGGGADTRSLAEPTQRPGFRLEVEFRPALSGLAMVLARRFVPLYARVPDEFRGWPKLAEQALTGKLAETGFRPELVLSFGEPMSDHLLGLRLKRRLGLPWLAHFSDPWADNPFRRGQPLANLVNRRLEASVIAAADRIVFTSEETLELAMRKYPAAWRGKAAVLPHAFDPALYPPRPPPGQVLTVRYLGNFYGHRTPIPLFRGLRLLLQREPEVLEKVCFELIGRVPPLLHLHPAWRALPAGLVRHVPTVSYARSLALMAAADLLLVVDAPEALSVFLPSKLVEYLGAGAPILGIVPPGAAARLIDRLGGICADPRDPEAVAAGLARALALARQWRAGTRPFGDAAVRDGYRIDRVAAQFMAMLQDLLAPE